MPSGTDFLEAIRAAYAEVHGHLGTFRYWHTTWLAGVSYVVTSTALFGGCSSPIGMLLFLNDRLDYRYWFGPLLAGLAIGAISFGVTTILSNSRWNPRTCCVCHGIYGYVCCTDRSARR